MRIRVLVAVRAPSVARFQEHLAVDPKLEVMVVGTEHEARSLLDDPTRSPEVFVLDNGLTDSFEWIKALRETHPRLMILLVDEDADFAMPGRADDISTEPFKDNDLVKKIKRLTEERSVQTLRADSLPGIRNFAKALRKVNRSTERHQAAVQAIRDLGYDHVLVYTITPGTPPDTQPTLSLAAQGGPVAVMNVIPNRVEPVSTNILTWVAQNGQSRIIATGDTPGHTLIEKGRYGAGICVPIGTTLRFGVILAFKEAPGSIRQEHIVILELISAQLASTLAKDQRS